MRKLFVLFLLHSTTCITGWAQGCSDAGFCSLDALRNITQANAGKHTFDIGSTFGIGEQQTFTINPFIQYGMRIGPKLSLAGKFTSTYATGFLGRAFAPGDFYGTITRIIKNTRQTGLRVLGGIKVPFTVANTKNAKGQPLPLDYQSSIGSYDLIGGINYISNEHVELNAGVQLPIIQVNRNTFFPDEYTDKRAGDFAPTNNFMRKADLLFRAGYYFKPTASVTIKPNILGIYHTGEDSYENRFGKRTVLQGSSGLTLNLGIIVVKTFKNNTQVEAIAATPFVVRNIRPDGLTREAAFSIQYSFSF